MAKNTILYSEQNGIRFNPQSLGDTQRALSMLKMATQRRVVRLAMSAALRPVAREAKRLAPRDSGQLRKAIGLIVRTYENTGKTVGVVGARHGFAAVVARKMWAAGVQGKNVVNLVAMRYANPANYIHLVEFGTKPHTIGGGASLRKQVKGGATHPGTKPLRFLERAWNAARGTFMSVFGSKLNEGVRREVAKLAGKARQLR